jgi:DNA-binding CsgD family transcriptional regulator
MSAHEVAELALGSRDRATFRCALLKKLDRSIGFDLANLGHTSNVSHYDLFAIGFDTRLAQRRLSAYMAEFDQAELAAMSSGRALTDVEIVSARRRSRLAMYTEFMCPHRVRVLTTSVWRNRFGGFGFVLARTGRGARFRNTELERLNELLPSIRLAEALFAAASPASETAPDGSAELPEARFAFTAREREISRLVTRGLRNREIAELLGVSHLTVRNQLSAMFRKADVTTRAELVYVLTTEFPERGRSSPHWPSWMHLISHTPPPLEPILRQNPAP